MSTNKTTECGSRSWVFDHDGCPQTAPIECRMPRDHAGRHACQGGSWPDDSAECTNGGRGLCPRCHPAEYAAAQAPPRRGLLARLFA